VDAQLSLEVQRTKQQQRLADEAAMAEAKRRELASEAVRLERERERHKRLERERRYGAPLRMSGLHVGRHRSKRDPLIAHDDDDDEDDYDDDEGFPDDELNRSILNQRKANRALLAAAEGEGSPRPRGVGKAGAQRSMLSEGGNMAVVKGTAPQSKPRRMQVEEEFEGIAAQAMEARVGPESPEEPGGERKEPSTRSFAAPASEPPAPLSERGQPEQQFPSTVLDTVSHVTPSSHDPSSPIRAADSAPPAPSNLDMSGLSKASTLKPAVPVHPPPSVAAAKAYRKASPRSPPYAASDSGDEDALFVGPGAPPSKVSEMRRLWEGKARHPAQPPPPRSTVAAAKAYPLPGTTA